MVSFISLRSAESSLFSGWTRQWHVEHIRAHRSTYGAGVQGRGRRSRPRPGQQRELDERRADDAFRVPGLLGLAKGRQVLRMLGQWRWHRSMGGWRSPPLTLVSVRHAACAETKEGLGAGRLFARRSASSPAHTGSDFAVSMIFLVILCSLSSSWKGAMEDEGGVGEGRCRKGVLSKKDEQRWQAGRTV